MSLETWKNLFGSEYYFISNRGRIKRVEHTITNSVGTKKRMREMFLTTVIGPSGFSTANPTINGKHKSMYIHRVVAEHFLPKPENSDIMRVNHIDGNKQNNDAANLEWVPRKKLPTASRRREVHKYSVDGKYIESFKSVRMAGDEVPEASVATLYLLSKTDHVFSGGFRWSYEKYEALPIKNKKFLPKRKVYQYDKSYNLIGVYPTVSDAQRETGINNVSRAANKILKTSGGYIWSYEKLHETKAIEM